MKRIIFIASTRQGMENYWQESSEWFAWAKAAKIQKDKNDKNDKNKEIDISDSKICISNSEISVAIVQNDDVKVYFGVENVSDIDKKLFAGELNNYDEIYVHGGGYKQIDYLNNSGKKAGKYTSDSAQEPLFMAVQGLIETLSSDKDKFLSEVENIWKAAIIKPLSNNIKVLSLSLLLDIAGYKECKSENCSKYLEAIPKDEISGKLKEKVSELDDVVEGIEIVIENIGSLCEAYNAIGTDQSKIDVNKVQKNYTELIKALDPLYAS